MGQCLIAAIVVSATFAGCFLLYLWRTRRRPLGTAVWVRSYPEKPMATNGLKQEIERLIRISGVNLGIFALHLESGRTVAVQEDVPFPMASTFKIPLAVELLSRADAGSIDLNAMIEVKAEDLRTGSGLLQMIFRQPRVTLSVLSCMELMIVGSDNSAADIVLRLVGGVNPVNERMQQWGIPSIRLHRTTAELISDYDAAPERFASDSRDHATPEGMTRLLAKIWEGECLQPSSARLLQGAMSRCETGPDRIPGRLPLRTKVAHKTGSMGAVSNDTGVVSLPDGTHFAITVFALSPGRTDAERALAIADVTRAAFDYFLFTGSNE